MSSGQSVTLWMQKAQAGDARAAQELWDRYFKRLVGLARKKLQGTSRRMADEEDVALSAFHSFFRGLQQGRFPQLTDRNNLWAVLITLTVRKADDLVKHQGRLKRGGGAVQGESAFLPREGTDAEAAGIDQVRDPKAMPDFPGVIEELLDKLGDRDLQQVAIWKMEGYTNEQIAAKLGCVPRTVDRKLRSIKEIWEPDVGGEAKKGPSLRE